MANLRTIYSLLISRLLLFAFLQALLAAMLGSWHESEKYWMLTATLTNLINICLLIWLFRQEGMKYLSIFHIDRAYWKKDIIAFLFITLISLPLVLAPSFLLSNLFWGNTVYYHYVLFQPVSVYLAYALLFIFPITIVFAELATYFGYIMPRLEKKWQHKWLAILAPVFFLSIQHGTLPLVFDIKFIGFRMLMYLPFSLMFGIVLHKRPRLLPYLAVLHGVLDALSVLMLLMEIKK